MAYFKIAKAVPIPNYKMDTPVYMSMTLAATAAAGVSTIQVTHVNPLATKVKSSLAFQRGDTITLTTSAGITEQQMISRSYKSGSIYYLALQSTLTNSFAIGDNVAGYGTGWPENWNHVSDSFNAYTKTTLMPAGGGYSDNYAFRSSIIDTQGTLAFALNTFDTDYFEEYCFYRFGAWMKQDVVSGGGSHGIRLDVNDGKKAMTSSYNNTDLETWAEITFKNLPLLTSEDLAVSRTDFGYVQFVFTSLGKQEVWIDDIYLEHIRGIAPTADSIDSVYSYPSGESTVKIDTSIASEFAVNDIITLHGYNSTFTTIHGATGIIKLISGSEITIKNFSSTLAFAPGARLEQANNGYYTFTEVPNMDTSWTSTSTISKIRGVNNNMHTFNPAGWGERATKKAAFLNFDNVDISFFKKMKLFENWCEQGNFVNIHGFATEFPDMKTDMIYGKLELTGMKHNIWNRNWISFSLLIEEV